MAFRIVIMSPEGRSRFQLNWAPRVGVRNAAFVPKLTTAQALKAHNNLEHEMPIGVALLDGGRLQAQTLCFGWKRDFEK